jgi:dynein heavy chain
MRSVATALAMAVSIKRKDTHLSEKEIILRALRESTTPMLIGEDIFLFHGILRDLFPALFATVDSPLQEDLRNRIVQAMKQQGLQPIPSFINKCLQVTGYLEVSSYLAFSNARSTHWSGFSWRKLLG